MSRILVVDDDPQVRTLLRFALERKGYAVSEAANGAEAVARFQPGEVALVITDIVMPEKEGIETIMELRGMDPDVKIIAISGGGRINPADYLNWVRRFGVEHTFAKPLEMQDLLAAVAQLMTAEVS